jgi:hypothetical protein
MVYWELNPEKDIANLGAQLTQSGKFPTKGTKIIAWYITSSIPAWGVTIAEAENEQAAFNDLLVWTGELSGFFTCYKASFC